MKIKKLNLGSGPIKADGWINYDFGLLPVLSKLKLIKWIVKIGWLPADYEIEWPRINLVDIRKPLPDKNNSVDYLYCSNVLEHFERDECLKILKECRRIMKKSGVLRVVVPDLKKLIKNYQNANHFNNEFFGYEKQAYGGILGKIKLMFIRGHQWMYDDDSFKEILNEAGFKKIKEYRRGFGEVPNLDQLDIKVHEKLGMYYEVKKV